MATEDAVRDPRVDAIEQPREVAHRVVVGVGTRAKYLAQDPRDDQATREGVPVEEVPETAIRGRSAEPHGIAHDRRPEDPPGLHLKRLVRPPLRLLDRGPLTR